MVSFALSHLLFAIAARQFASIGGMRCEHARRSQWACVLRWHFHRSPSLACLFSSPITISWHSIIIPNQSFYAALTEWTCTGINMHQPTRTLRHYLHIYKCVTFCLNWFSFCFAVLCAKNLAKKDFFRKYFISSFFFFSSSDFVLARACVTQLRCAQCCYVWHKHAIGLLNIAAGIRLVLPPRITCLWPCAVLLTPHHMIHWEWTNLVAWWFIFLSTPHWAVQFSVMHADVAMSKNFQRIAQPRGNCFVICSQYALPSF